MPLKPQHIDFIGAYLTNGNNITAAARTAGFAERSAAQQGSRLMKRDDIQGELARRRRLAEKKLAMTLERLVTEVSHAAMFDAGELFDEAGNEIPIHKLPEHVRRAIASIEQDQGYRKLRMVSKTTSQELLAKLCGFLKPETQQQAVQIIVNPVPERPPVDPNRAKLQPEWE